MDYFDEYEKEAAVTKTSEKGHGRIETREYYLLTDISWLEQKSDWRGLKSVGMVKSNVIENGETRTYTRYFISSLTKIDELASLVFGCDFSRGCFKSQKRQFAD